MREHHRRYGTRGRSIRRAGGALVAAALLPLLAGQGDAWAQPAPTPSTMAATASPDAGNELDPKPIEALKRMGAFLHTLRTFTVHAETTKDEQRPGD